MNEEELLDLISQGESETLEFKSSFDTEAYESIAAFSNARGGRLLIGVSDSGKINGINYSNEQIKNIINEIKTKIEPHIIPDVYQVSVGSRIIFVFEVIEFPLKPVSLKGRYFVRIGSSNHSMSPSEIADMYLRTRNTSWDFYPDEDKTIDDLDENKILRVKKMIEDNLELDLGDVMDFLKKYSLVDKKNGKEYPTHAAMLLFSKEPLIDTEIQIGLFQDEITIKKSKLIKTDLISEVEEVMDFIKAYILKEYIITGKPTREERWQYPLDALREFVINAIVHRDYRGVHSQFKVFSDKIMLWNSGWLPLGLTIEDIKSGKDKSVPRNKLIAEIFRDARVMERYGRGISGAIKHIKDYGLPEPEITEE
jgi:ATP-dependent DNA helicase RecG